MDTILVTPLLIMRTYDLRVAIKTMEMFTVLEMTITNYPTSAAIH